MRVLLLASLLVSPVLGACDTATSLLDDGPADIAGDEAKADGATPGIEVLGRAKPGTIDTNLSVAMPRVGYVVYVGESSSIGVEVTHSGTSAGLDTIVKVYGPRLADGTYPKTIASDDDAGYGKLSKVSKVAPTVPGFYLVEVSFGPSATPVDNMHARVKFDCTGTCDTALPIQPIDEGLKWFRRSAERHALTLQTYGVAAAKLNEKVAAGVSANWAVVLDVDETTLNNSDYQQARLDLGVGFSPNSWTAWVNKRAASAIDGVVAFTNEVQALGGKVVLVTNRKAATECAQTEDNLHTAGVHYDAILCQTDMSDKNPRFAAVAAGTAAPNLPALEVVMFVGDNIQDFPGLTQDIRKQGASAFAAFGERFMIIPNPMYGSFDKNLD